MHFARARLIYRQWRYSVKLESQNGIARCTITRLVLLHVVWERNAVFRKGSTSDLKRIRSQMRGMNKALSVFLSLGSVFFDVNARFLLHRVSYMLTSQQER